MSETTAPRVRTWILALGITGFAAGFFGPMMLNSEANQGPLLGIFITGPGGVLAGALLGVIFKWLPLSDSQKRFTLLAICGLCGVTVLYFCLPEPKVRGYVIDGTIASCSPPEERIDDAINHWEKRIAEVTWAAPRSGWKQDVERMLREGGVVITVRQSRENRILEHRKPWNHGHLTASTWRATGEDKSYFARYAGEDCANYVGKSDLLYIKANQGSNEWPPRDLQNFLELAAIEPLADQYRALIKP